MNIEIPLFDHN